MLEALRSARLDHARIDHVRTSFARDMRDMGRLRLAKVAKVLPVLARMARARLRGADVLYFTPSGPARLAFVRDAVLLLAGRWMFRRTVLHFHAAGLTELASRMSPVERALLHVAFSDPDVAILTSDRNPRDDLLVRARRSTVVPCGVADVAPRFPRRPRGPVPLILYVGLLGPTKGVGVLLEACRSLAGQGRPFELALVGQWQSDRFRRFVQAELASPELAGRVRLEGELTGDAKWRLYQQADLFCYPTFFEAESFGLVLVEAMSFSLPVVATEWRGVPDVVQEGETGFLVPPGDAPKLADRIARLLDDPPLRETLGANGRNRYLERFTLERHLQRLDELFASLEAGGPCA